MRTKSEKAQQICTALELESIVFFIPYGENCPTGLIDDYVYADQLLSKELGEQNGFLNAEDGALRYNYGLTDAGFWQRVTGKLADTKKGVVYTSFYRLSNYSKTEYYGCVAVSMERSVISRNISALYGERTNIF